MRTLQVYPRLSTRSKRAMMRRNWRGKRYTYRPRPKLMLRLQAQLKEELGLNLSIEQVWNLIREERHELLKSQGYEVKPWE